MACVTLYDWPHVLLTEFSVAYGEPEYRNALCAQIGEEVVEASLEEGDALTIELANGVVLALSLREEDVDAPVSGSYSETGSGGQMQRSFRGEMERMRSRRTYECSAGVEIEVEEMGTVALIGLLLVPGLLWMARGKTGAQHGVAGGGCRRGDCGRGRRLRFAMDRTANSASRCWKERAKPWLRYG